MPDFKTHYLMLMITILFVLGFFWLIRNSESSGSVTGLETVTGRVSYSPENDAEQLVLNYLEYFNINANIKNSYYKNGLWKVEVDILDSDDDVIFDVTDANELKCFERFRERKCFDNFNEFILEFMSGF